MWLFPNRDTPLSSVSVRIVFSVKSGGKTIAPLNYAAKVLLFSDMCKLFAKKLVTKANWSAQNNPNSRITLIALCTPIVPNYSAFARSIHTMFHFLHDAL